MTLLARRLVEPDHHTGPRYIETLGPAVAELNAKIGFAPDPQQELALNDIFGIREDGLSACFEYGCVVCRQNLKTGLLKQVAIGWLFVSEVPWFVWSAHEMTTTVESQREIHALIADSSLSKMLPATKNQGLYEDNNKTRVELKTGQRILFKARTVSGGRGLAAPKVILDEAFALKPAQVGALIPTLAAQDDPQVVYASSAGKADAVILADVAERGRKGTSIRLGYVEWCAPWEPCRDDAGAEDPDCTHPKDAPAQGLDCALDREHLWLKANPTISSGRITLETIAGLRQALPPLEFARECLGWWDKPDDGAAATFGPGRWEACAVEPDFPTTPGALGLAVSVDGLWASIAAATVLEESDEDDDTDEDGPGATVFVAPVDRREDTAWVAAELKRMQDEHDCVVVLDEKGPAAALIDDLDEHDVAYETVNLDENAKACARIFRKVRESRLRHPSGEELDTAVAGAEWRWVGDRRVWGRKQSVRDVSMLEAATFAAYGAEEFGVAIW